MKNLNNYLEQQHREQQRRRMPRWRTRWRWWVEVARRSCTGIWLLCFSEEKMFFFYQSEEKMFCSHAWVSEILNYFFNTFNLNRSISFMPRVLILRNKLDVSIFSPNGEDSDPTSHYDCLQIHIGRRFFTFQEGQLFIFLPWWQHAAVTGAFTGWALRLI